MYLTPGELRKILDLAASASAPAGNVYALAPVLARAIQLAGQDRNIVPEIVPAPEKSPEPYPEEAVPYRQPPPRSYKHATVS